MGKLPPVNRQGGELCGPDVLEFAVVSLTVSPEDPTTTGVGIVMKVQLVQHRPPVDLVCRITSARAVDFVIQALLRHKRHVWPDAP